MKILKVPLTDTYFITIFNGGSRTNYSISTSGYVTEHNSKYITTDFHNLRESFSSCKMLGKVSEFTEEKIKTVFKAAGLESPYINYTDRTQTFDTALDSFKSFLASENWEFKDEDTWVIIPKPSKKLNGSKIIMEFEVGALDFSYGSSKMDLEVFQSPITKTSKSLTFSMKVPDFLYNKCMTDTDVKQRPTQDYIECDTIASLHSGIDRYVEQARKIWDMEKDAASAKKVLCINFSSTEHSDRDSYNFAYLGQKIDTSFNFYVAYKTDKQMFSYKKLQSGMGTTERGIKGIIDYEPQGARNYILERPKIIIDWTQEREDFLIELESKFRALSVNLNSFLKDLTEDKLENLIKNSEQLKLS